MTWSAGSVVTLARTVHSETGSGYRGDVGRVVRVDSPPWSDDLYDIALTTGVRLVRVRADDLVRPVDPPARKTPDRPRVDVDRRDQVSHAAVTALVVVLSIFGAAAAWIWWHGWP